MRRVAAFSILVIISGFVLSNAAALDSSAPKTEFVYARIRYHMTRDAIFVREVPWHHDYPFGDETFPTFVKEVTGTDTKSDSYQIVDIDSPELFDFPFAYLCEPGYLNLNDEDAENFREYLDRGGFVFVDDFRGPRHLDNLVREMKKVYPNRDIARLDISEPIFNSFNYNSDLSEVWEWLDKGELPVSAAALSLKLGVNYLVYAFTH